MASGSRFVDAELVVIVIPFLHLSVTGVGLLPDITAPHTERRRRAACLALPRSSRVRKVQAQLAPWRQSRLIRTMVTVVSRPLQVTPRIAAFSTARSWIVSRSSASTSSMAAAPREAFQTSPARYSDPILRLSAAADAGMSTARVSSSARSMVSVVTSVTAFSVQLYCSPNRLRDSTPIAVPMRHGS